MATPDSHKPFYSLDELANQLGISRSLARKSFKVVKIGRRVVVRRADFEAVIKEGVK
jgi:hypothetical protein